MARVQIVAINYMNAQTIDDPRNFNGVWPYKTGTSKAVSNSTGFPGTKEKYTFSELKEAYPFISGVLNPIQISQ